MSNLKIGTKLICGFLAVSCVSLVIGIYGFIQIHRISDAGLRLFESGVMPMKDIATISANFQRMRVNTRDLVAASEQKDIEHYRARIDEFRHHIDEAAQDLEKRLPDEATKKLYTEFVASRKGYTPHLEKIITLARENKDAEAIEYMKGDANKAVRAEMDAIDKLEKEIETDGKEISGGNTATAKTAGAIMIAAACIGSIAAFVFGFIIARVITTPLKNLVVQARKVSEGDLRVVIDHHSGDETGELSEAFRTMTDNLRTIISKVSETSTLVVAASSQLHTTAEQIANGAEEVASQAGTVATAGEEMSATSGDIAVNCQLAADGARKASETAQNGALVVERTVTVMAQIADKVQETAKTVESLGGRSDQIGAIIGTIEDIADQTNLLALNAAIEAARAGEQGRGFAVVADEVRALAERTTKATREIGDMIKAIQSETRGAVAAMEQGVRQVEMGTDEASRSGSALQEILEQVNGVAMQINQVATAAEEQTATTSEISSNMMQITEVVQVTSRGAHESAGAAAQLRGNAEEMQRLVQQFRL